MALCDHCQAEIEGKIAPMDPQWFDEGNRFVNGSVHHHLAPAEWRLLRELWIGCGHIVARRKLYDRMFYEHPNPPEYRILNVYITRVRKTLVGTPYRIETHWGHGFRLVKEQYDDAVA